MNTHREKSHLMLSAAVVGLLAAGLTGVNAAPENRQKGDDTVIHLESGVVQASHRQAIEKGVNGRPTKMALNAGESLRKLGQTRNDRAWYIVRVKGPRVAQIREQIAAAGAKIAGYVQYYSFLVKMDSAVAEKVAAIDDVEWIGPYEKEHRLSQSLTTRVEKWKTGLAGRAAPKADAGEPQIELDVHLFSLEGIEDLSRFVVENGGTVKSQLRNENAPKLRIIVPLSLVEKISAISHVRVVYEHIPRRPANDKAAVISGVTTNIRNTYGLTGSNQVIGNADTGLDVGTTGPTMNPEFRGRIRAAFALGRTNDWSDCDGHGTHTAGTLLGNGANSAGQYRGVAYEAQLVHQAVMDYEGSFEGLPDDYGELFEQAYTNGARIHSDSWGATHYGEYGDAVYLDAWAWNNGVPRDMLIVVCAGNEGPGPISIDEPGTAKNCLTVGATENDRPTCGDEGDNTNQVAEISSRGPTMEGRTKPDLVAPGTWIVSTKTRANVISFSDDMEQGINGWTEEDTYGPAATPWIQSTSDSRTTSHSWYYQQNGTFDDFLITPSFTVSNTPPVRVTYLWRGTLAADTEIYLCYRVIGGSPDWTYIDAPYSGPLSETNWTWDFWEPDLAGKTVQCGINVYSPSGGSADIYVDDFTVQTFDNTDDMFAQGLAARGDNMDMNYTLFTGTSMSTPLAAGSVALVRQFYQTKKGLATPSAALLKATLINGATDLNPATPRPDNDQGWGRLSLENSLYPRPPRTFLYYDETNIVTEGSARTFFFVVTNSTEQLRATLVWTDKEGATLQNDLDLNLTAPDATAYMSTDNVNNVEGKDIISPQTGMWRAEIEGATVPYGPQPFALIISGAVAATNAGTTVQFAASESRLSESSLSTTIPVTISSSCAATVQVAVAGTATPGPGADFTCSPTTIVFTAGGSTTQLITVIINDDTVPNEGSETAELTLRNCVGATISGPSTYVLTIDDNDGPQVIFKEGFNSSALPLGWETNIVNDVSNVATESPAIYFVTQSYSPDFTPAEGTCFVEFNSSWCDRDDQARLKFTNGFSTVGYTNICVNYMWAGDDTYSADNDYMVAQWSTNTIMWRNFATNYRFRAAGPAWLSKSAVLPPTAAGRSGIYLLFLFVSRWGSDCHLDDLRVTGIPTQPTAQLTYAAQDATNSYGWVTISNTVYDAGGDVCQLEVMYSTNSGVLWSKALILGVNGVYGAAVVSNNAVRQIVNIATTNGAGTAATNTLGITWDTANSQPLILLCSNTLIRTRAWDGVNWSAPSTSQPFVVDNGSFKTLTVVSDFGAASPPPGTYIMSPGTGVTCCVTSTVVTLAGGITQGVFAGWIGAGSVPSSGSATNVSFTLTNNSSITWLWTTNYWSAPQWWLVLYGLTNASFDVEAMKDVDGDKAAAWEEWVAGTIPTNAQSVFKLVGVDTAAGGYVLRWSSVNGKHYSIQRTTNLFAEFAEVVASNIPATPAFNVFTNAVGGKTGFYYRVTVQ